MKKGRSAHALLGLVALVLFAAAVAGTGFVLRGGLQSGVPVRAIFSTRGVGQQLPVGGDVKVRGVLVGRIAAVELRDDGRVEVELALDPETPPLPRGTRAAVGSKTLFGQKWIELIPPRRAGGRALGAGDVIPDSATEEPLELERQLELGSGVLRAIPLQELAALTRTLAEGFGGSERAAAAAIDRGLVALRAVNSRADRFDLALRQLAQFAAWADDHDDELVSFMDSLDAANRALVGAAPEFRASLSSVPTFLEDFASFQELTERDLGRLIEDGATVAEMLAMRRQDLVDLVVGLEAFLTVWNSGLSQPCEGLYDSDMTCWRLYLMPGLESRGLYGPEDPPPNADEPGDPGPGLTRPPPRAAQRAGLAATLLPGGPQ